MSDEHEVRAAALPVEAAVDEDGVTIAFVKVNVTADSFYVGVHWLPEFFAAPLPDTLRAAIVKHLRYHAEKLESGDVDARMQRHIGLNINIKRHDA